jgi:putative MFS transporter
VDTRIAALPDRGGKTRRGRSAATPRLTAVSSDYVLRNSALLGLPLTVVIALLYGFWSSRRTIILLSALTAVVFAISGASLVNNRTLLSVLLVIQLAGISSVVAVVTAYSAEIALITTATPSLAWTALIGAIPLLVAVVAFIRYAPDTHQRRLEDITESVAV